MGLRARMYQTHTQLGRGTSGSTGAAAHRTAVRRHRHQALRASRATGQRAIKEIAVNRIYRVIWSKVRNTWIVTSELATGFGKSSSAKVVPSRMPEPEVRISPRAWPLRIAILPALLSTQARA